LAVVGHNPSIGELTAVLDDGQGSPAAQRELDVGFHTSGVAVALAETPAACAVQS
jgi:phosphohistidine phosphatase